MFIIAIILCLCTVIAVFIAVGMSRALAALPVAPTEAPLGDEAEEESSAVRGAKARKNDTAAVPTRKGVNVARGVAALLGAGTLAALFASTFYVQDEGQAKVLLSFDGRVVGQDVTPGADFKAPWVSLVTYDTRNQQVLFGGSADANGSADNGSQITIQDREGVTANIDISVRYSVDPGSVTEIYKKYQTQENFVSRFIENDIRAGVRTVPAQYGTLELLNNRAKAEKEITEYLEARWNKQGVKVETVSLQEIRYSSDVTARFDDAQASRIKVEQARAELEATEVSAQQKIVQAEAEAEANRKLAESLTDPILKQRYLDTLSTLGQSGNLVVVPEGFNGMLNLNRE